MKIDRLIGIITILQQYKKVTAPFLAEKFEVSRRTINRDIEDICRAGIPIVTTQGSNGGISIMEGFALDTTVFTEQELSAVFTGLKTLDSVSFSQSADKLARKIGANSAITLSDHITIDLSSFYKTDLSSKIELMKTAIKNRHCIAFHYYYNKGEADKYIEPYQIIFKWSDWYIFGYCRERNDFRMYKLRRLWNLCLSDEIYEVRNIPEEKKNFGAHMTDDYMITAIYDSSVKYKLVEEYGPDSFSVMEDGRLYAQWGFNSPERCGLHCTGCKFKDSNGCGGCIETNGHPFHGECPVALCCQNKGIVHCGECPDIPCELLTQYSFDPEHGDTPNGARIEQCKKWKEEQDAKY